MSKGGWGVLSKKRGRLKGNARYSITKYLNGKADAYDIQLICWSYMNNGCAVATPAIIHTEMPEEVALDTMKREWDSIHRWMKEYL